LETWPLFLQRIRYVYASTLSIRMVLVCPLMD
jgi:hypothetical protein